MIEEVGILEIKLLSETILGGESADVGTVDIELQRDIYGVPYFSGRTIKGLLRKEAEWFVRHLQGNEKQLYKEALNNLFGKPDQRDNDVHHANYQSLKFSDAKLSDRFYQSIKRHSLTPREVTQALTNIRTMTSIDPETGTAKDHSLRQVRVFKKGYTLFSTIFSSRTLTQVEKDLLDKAVKLLRRIGLMRSRGKGEVSCRLDWRKLEKTRTDNFKSSKKNQEQTYLQLHIDVQEPLKINDILRTSDSTYALTYIPGYVLRGALIHAYIKDRGLKAEHVPTEEIFNEEKIQFWNGYLTINEKRSLPFPHHLFETKESSKDIEIKERRVYNALDEKSISKIRDQSPVKVNYDVMTVKDGKLYGAKVKRNSALHLSLKEKSDSKLYRYESISPNQKFTAVVTFKGENDFTNWLENKQFLTLWLGGARNSGYGRSHVTISKTKRLPETLTTSFHERSEDLYVIATSDWILHDHQGKLTTSLDEMWLGEQLGVKLTLKSQIISTNISGGYVFPWRAYQPMIDTVGAGSIFHYKIISGKLDKQKIVKIMHEGLGQRRNEGFGRFIILSEWPFHKLSAYDGVYTPTERQTRKHRDYKEEDQEIANFYNSFIQEKIKQQVRKEVNEWFEAMKDSLEKISSSQWGRLMQITTEIEKDMSNLPQQAKEIYSNRWSIFWNDLKGRQKSKWRYALEHLDITIEGNQISFEHFLRNFLEEKNWNINHPLASQVEINHLYWTVQALKLFFRKIIRWSPRKEK